MFLLYTAIAIIATFIVRWILKQNEFNKKIAGIPGPKTVPILGNVLSFINATEIIPNLMKFQDELGGVYKLKFGPIFTYLVISDPEWLEFLLSSNKLIKKSHDYDFMYKWLGHGLLSAPVDYWRKTRKALTPSFHFQILEQFVSRFKPTLDILIKKLEKEAIKSNNETDIYPFITLTSLDTICETAMGISVYAQEKDDSEYVTAIRKMLRILSNRTFSPWKQFDFMYNLSSDYREEIEAIKVLHKTTNDVIKKRREELSRKVKGIDNNDENLGIKKREALLDLLININIDGKPFTDDEIRQEVDTIMFAGHDTTASAMAFTLHCLANNPEVQKKVYEELQELLGDNRTETPSHRDFQNMKYLEMVIKESLRLYPSVHLFGRDVTEDILFKGITLPKGLSIAVCTYTAHRTPSVFPDPEKFDPERFTAENQGKRSPFSYVPFSAGPRNCIGQKFAMLSMKATLSRVLMNFEVLKLPHRELILSAETILKSANGIYVQLKKR